MRWLMCVALPRRQPLHHQPSENRIDLRRLEPCPAVRPPLEHSHERAGNELHCQLSLAGRLLQTDGLDPDTGELRDHRVKTLKDEPPALLAHDHPIYGKV